MGDGIYRRRHYTTWVDDVKEHKRAGENDRAIDLLLALLPVIEAECKTERMGVPSWYHQQLAIIYRKQKDYAAEVDILDSYVRLSKGDPDPTLLTRRRKAKAKLKDATAGGQPANCPACHAPLSPIPPRTRLCPHCRERIIVSRKDGIVTLLTEDQDESSRELQEAHRSDNQWLQIADEFRIPESAVKSECRESKCDTATAVIWLLEDAVEQATELHKESRLRRGLAKALAKDGDELWIEQTTIALSLEAQQNQQTMTGRQLVFGGCRCSACAPSSEVGARDQGDQRPHADCRDAPCTCRVYSVAEPEDDQPEPSDSNTASTPKRRSWLGRLRDR